MKKFTRFSIAAGLAVGLSTLAGTASAHSGGTGAGQPTCIESNIMMADAENAPFSNQPGAGRVLEMNTTTGERGITVESPFADPLQEPLCPPHVSCPGPFKPTGNVSGGEDGHAYLVSAAQHALIEHHRDGTAIKTSPLWPTSPSPNGGNFGFVPRLLGNGFMPNGNIAQAVCDANFFNANNSDTVSPNGNTHPSGNASNLFFPPVYSTPRRGANGRVLIVDQDTMEVVDEYSKPGSGPYANDPRWNCPAGVLFTSEGMFVSMFHGDAVFVIDWKAGMDNEKSEGVGSNSPAGFKLGKKKNEAKVIRVIDLEDPDGNGAPDAPYYDSGHRRDNLRAIRMSEDGTLYGTRRSRSAECNEGDACNPGNFRQHIFIVEPGESHNSGKTIALDPGVNIIAGITVNRMSAPGCKFVTGGLDPTTVTGDICDVETLYIGVSAANAGCTNMSGPPPNRCFVRGGTLYEYRIDEDHLDGGAAWGGVPCTGNPGDGSTGCALPIAQFDFVAQGDGTDADTSNLPDGTIETLDPRMVMTIHEAFVQ